MSVPMSLRLADRERMFADWGEPVVLELVTSTYVGATESVSEAIESVAIEAIPLRDESPMTVETAGMELGRRAAWRVRREDWPDAVRDAVRRIVAGEMRYRIVETRADEVSATIVLTGEREGV
jgi:hypothetical protein